VNGQKYQLGIYVTLTAVEKLTGYPTGGRLEVREEHVVTADTFLEVAQILGRFHELAVAVNAEKAPK
jgi:hypothetical protein